MEYARRGGLDLIEINPTAVPPVCKIADYGKMMYERSKRRKAIGKTKALQAKTIQVRPNIGDSDLTRKISCIQKFLDKGHKVLVQVVMRGRQKAFPRQAESIVHQIQNQLEEATMDPPKLSGSAISTCFSKKKA